MGQQTKTHSKVTEEPVCSICIANYNGMGIIEDCLNSVFAQDCDFLFEVIVHDDASTDDSLTVLRNCYPSVNLIASDINVGFCVSNNRMATIACGRYILLLNNDAILFPDALSTLYDEAQKLSPAILGLPQYDAKTGVLVDIGSLSDPFLNPIPNLDPQRKDVAMIVGACLWIPKSLWQDLGGFPEWFHTVAEDMYLCCLARLWGYPVRVVSHSGFRHWMGSSLGGGGVKANRLSSNVRRRQLSERNKSFVMVLTYPSPLFQFIFPLHITLLVAEGAILALVRRDRVLFRDIYLGCLKVLWAERERLMYLRGQIQSGRKSGLRQFWSAFLPFPQKLRLLFRHGWPEVT
ncbi:glycosyltransferase family 2 protein [Sulfurirhabdus autotrophica]|uniref:GT2 family glycosyltransferase n=1 Tax=Sulfurirhabdus autotrophica TaxID=1706046 RepID=A0A4R3XRC7_9PROT|nr:glycosyltransferase [Sulfurirhabdus autotrophica]TCV79100.1 GT2 family glycosyltransferase [Sulfurirhabdus autotrophica]